MKKGWLNLAKVARLMKETYSFWKQDPPNPTEALRNLAPIRESLPTAKATSSMLAPVASQMAERALTEEIRCRREGRFVSEKMIRKISAKDDKPGQAWR